MIIAHDHLVWGILRSRHGIYGRARRVHSQKGQTILSQCLLSVVLLLPVQIESNDNSLHPSSIENNSRTVEHSYGVAMGCKRIDG